MLCLLETNILVRISVPSDPLHPLAARAVVSLRSVGDELVVTPQVLMEWRSVATRPADHRGNGLGMSAAVADAEVQRMCALFHLLPDTPDVFHEWVKLVATHSVMGRQVYDARLVAVMVVNSVSRVLTFDASDFARYDAIVPLDPRSLQPN